MAAEVAPWIERFEEQVKQMGPAAGVSVHGVLAAHKYLIRVLIQDSAASLAATYPDHDVMQHLLQFAEFRYATQNSRLYSIRPKGQQQLWQNNM